MFTWFLVYSTELDFFFFSEENRMKLAAETECLPCNLEQNKGQIAGRRNGDSHNQNTECLPLGTYSEPERNTLGRGQAEPRLCPLWSDTLGPQLCVDLAGGVEGQRSYFQSHQSSVYFGPG